MAKQIFGTKEWASSNENIMFGCRHNCAYCYSKAMSIRHKKIDINHWDKPILRQDQLTKSIGKRKGTIMFPSTHDLHIEHITEIIYFLEKLLSPGNKVLIVSKPNFEVIRKICDVMKPYREQILFRFTIGSAYYKTLKFWEPMAPLFNERLTSLRHAHSLGYKTSVSCEPMLDQNINDVINLTSEYVTDSIWLGKMNDPTRRLKINGHPDIPEEFKEGIKYWMDDENIFDLYERYHNDPMIKWKESIKKVIGLELSSKKGLDK